MSDDEEATPMTDQPGEIESADEPEVPEGHVKFAWTDSDGHVSEHTVPADDFEAAIFRSIGEEPPA